jgi:proteasome lid subunit RPN8/RPN11
VSSPGAPLAQPEGRRTGKVGAPAGLLTAEELAAIHEHARAEYPAECCGVLLVRPAAADERKLMACRNIQDDKHREDPDKHPRTSREAYYMHPEDALHAQQAEQHGYRLDVIYHSHIDAGAYFSATDVRNATWGGEPSYPGCTYVVVALDKGQVTDTRAHRWSPETREFVEIPLVIGERIRAESR